MEKVKMQGWCVGARTLAAGPDARAGGGRAAGCAILCVPVSGKCAISPALLAMLLLWACAPAPESYPPPFQRRVAGDTQRPPVGNFVNMNDSEAEAYFLRDISPSLEAGQWRWTFQRPELRFWLGSTTGQKLTMDLAIADATFKHTGPVAISFYVNERLLAKVRYAKPGNYHFEKEVPSSWLKAGAFTHAAAQADKLYVSENDKVRLGFILIRAGFVS